MANINNGIELIENKEFIEAYNYFNEIVKENPKNIDALYYRAFVDFFHIRKDIFSDYNAFKILVDKNTKYKENVLPLLVIAADELSLSTEVIKYGRMSLKYDNPYEQDVKNILIKALALDSEINSHLEAFKMIEEIIHDDEDAPLEVYIQKADIQVKFNDLDGADKTMEEIFTRFPANAMMYFMKGRLALAFSKKYHNDVTLNKEYLLDAIRAFEVSLQYDNNLNGSRIILAETHALMGDIDEAFKALDGFKEAIGKDLKGEQLISFEADLVVEKVKLCETTKNWELGINICNEFLENHDAWKVYYSLGYIQNVISTNYDELLTALGNIKKAYFLSNDTFLLTDVVNINTILKRFEDNDEIIKEALKKEPDNGLLYYLLAENTARFDYDYNTLISYYDQALKLGYLDEAGYITHVSFLVEEPLKLAKKAKKVLSKSVNKSVWDKRRSAIRYLFGEFGFKQDIVKANHILEICNKMEPNEPCIQTIYARSLEFLGKNEEAFEIYRRAYEIYLNSLHLTCNCASGYYAHCLINGIGTKPNIELAKKVIREGILKEKGLSASIVIYLYAYFALKDDPEFSLENALEYLSSNFAFDRYDIVRYLLTNMVCDRLNKQHIYDEQMIKKCLKQLPKEYSKFYKANKDKNIVYPYYKNF